MIKSHSYIDFFPYPVFRSEQQEIIERIERGARLKKNILLSAPNGTGKTVTVLSALLPVALENDLKIIYMCRTHTQNKRVIKELKRIYNSSNQYSSKISGLSIRGRGEMCLHRKILNSKMGPKEAMTECKALRSNQKCPHYRNLKEETNGLKEPESVSFSSPVDGEELIELPCPMVIATDILKISLPKSPKLYKWPNVEETWNYLFPDKKYIEKHRGYDDAVHEALIIFELYKMNKWRPIGKIGVPT
ncbi:hypothetical protein LCGC14_1063450 [marine sediment metagenome]|uniref:Helicase ATP-binding domain-containing protein n=1 Tax=marine sediment metagenome TaxID=412755 RepID=A0A0F9MKI2_9ZZZZ